jgi:hypothetical protein
MIRYDLICADGHAFDAWFRDSAAYDDQARQGFVTCGICGSTRVEKQIMAPAIAAKGNREETKASVPMFSGPADPRAKLALAMMRELREKVVANAEYVGPRFAEEARKIHYEEAEKRGIYGEASLAEARALADEGIEAHPLPILPEDTN